MLLPVPQINFKAAAAAFMASQCLNNKLPVTDEQICCGFRSVFISGRQEIINGPVKTVLDVGHNPQAVKLLSDFIKKQPRENIKIHAVFSALKDKDLCGLIEPLKDLVDAWFPALLTGNRATPKEKLEESFINVLNYAPTCFDNPLLAYNKAKSVAEPGDFIVVYGSFMTVSTVLAAMSQ